MASPPRSSTPSRRGSEVYTYRLDNVPAFVPPGHGLVYLAALCLRPHGASFRWHARRLVTVTVVLGGALRAVGRQPVGAAAGRPGALLVPVPARLPAVGSLAAALRRGLPRRDVPRADRHVRSGRGPGSRTTRRGWSSMGNPPSGRRRRLRLVRPGGDHARTRAACGGGHALEAPRSARAARGAAARWTTSALPPTIGDEPSSAVIAPPASSTTGTSAAMSHPLSSGSTATSTDALGHQHVRPEVAVRAGPPDARRAGARQPLGAVARRPPRSGRSTPRTTPRRHRAR